MRTKLMVLFMSIAVMTLTSVATVQALDVSFTFIVPVKLSNLPQGTPDGTIICNVTDSYFNMLIQGRQNFSISPDGNFSGNVVVKASGPTQFDPTTAMKYSCIMQLTVNGKSQSPQTVTEQKPDTPLKMRVDGDVPISK